MDEGAPAKEPTDAVVAKADKDEAATPPESVQQQDLERFPEKLRSKLSSWSKEELAVLDGNFVPKPVFTQKTQEAARMREEAKKIEEKAELWDRLSTQPAALRAAMDVLDGKGAEKAADPDDEVDPIMLDGPGLKAFIARQAAKQAAAIVDQKIRETVTGPETAKTGIVNSLASFAEENGYDLPTMKAAVELAKNHAKSLGVAMTPQNAVELVMPFVKKSAPSEQPARNGSGGLSKVASPNGRGAAATIPPSELPAMVREKRGSRSHMETKDFAVHVLREHFGRDATTRDLEDLLERR